MYTWITTRSGRSFRSSRSTCSSVIVTSSSAARYAARVASPNGGKSAYLIGRKRGLVASVREGRIIFTFMMKEHIVEDFILQSVLFEFTNHPVCAAKEWGLFISGAATPPLKGGEWARLETNPIPLL